MKNEKTGEDMVSIGFVVELDYADATTSAHDLLQTFKTHPLVRKILEGGERVAWGAKALPGGGYWSMPKLSMPGAVLVGDSGGMVDTMALKGVHHCIKSGMLAAESIYAALKRGSQRLLRLRASDRELLDRQRAVGGAQRAPAIAEGPVPRRTALAVSSRSPRASSRVAPTGTATTRSRCSSATPRTCYVKPDGKYTFDKLSIVFITGNATRDDAPNHIRVQKHVPREVAETWRWMCPAGVYEIPEDAPERGRIRRGRDRQLHQLRAVRGDHRQGWAPHRTRGGRRSPVSDHLSVSDADACASLCAKHRGLMRVSGL